MGSLAFTAPTAQEIGEDRFFPDAPKTLDDLGVNPNILVDLMLKATMLEGQTNLNRLSDLLKISVALCGAVFQHLRKENMSKSRAWSPTTMS